MKEITFDEAAHKRIKAGVDKLANVVKSTLGPGGSNIIIETTEGFLRITKDGVSVAMEIDLEDKLENIGAQIVKEASAKTAVLAGDGTTTATVLAQAIYTAGLKNLAAGAKGIDLKRGIDKAVEYVVKHIKEHSIKVENVEDIQNVAMVSSNGDKEISYLITEAMNLVGHDGLVLVEDSRTDTSEVKKVEGLRFERGFLNHAFMTDPDKQEVLYDKPYILITDQVITNLQTDKIVHEKGGIMNDVSKTGRPLIIIAEDVQGAALTMLVLNRNKQGWMGCAIQAPDFGEVRKENLKDLAALTGATIISKEAGLSFEKMNLNHLGTCDKIRVTQWATFIINENPGIKLTYRLAQIDEQIKAGDSNDNAIKWLKQRYAILKNGVATIKVGGKSEIEIREKKDRIDDALSATRAAVEEGIVPGGGVAYIRAMMSLDEHDLDLASEDEATGVDIIYKALSVPLKTIVENIGGMPEVVVAKVMEGTGAFGYDAKKEEYVHMVSEGIIDPAKVTRMALESAASVAGALLTTNAVVSKIQAK